MLKMYDMSPLHSDEMVCVFKKEHAPGGGYGLTSGKAKGHRESLYTLSRRIIDLAPFT